MMGLRTTLVTVFALAVSCTPTFAQGMRTASGNNPLERISGADYAGAGALGRTNTMPSYTSRYSLANVSGGRDSRGYYWTAQRNGNGIDPRTGQQYTENRNNPFLYPYVRTPGGQLGGGVTPAAPSNTPAAPSSTAAAASTAIPNTMPQVTSNVAASGIYAGVNNGQYYTQNMGSYYTGGGLNGMAYPGGLYGQSSAAYNGFNTAANGSSYNYGISSYGLANNATNPYASSYGYGMGGVGGVGVGAGAGVSGMGGNAAYGAYSGYGYNNMGYGYGYSNVRTLVPGIVGGAVGALVGRYFGPVGMIAGGIGGFLVGSFLGNQARQMPFSGLYDNYNAMVDTQYGNQYSYYHGLYDYYGNSSSTSTGPLPGVAGAVLGAVIGKCGGLPGMLIGGVVGFIGGQLLGHVLMPQSQYGNSAYNSYDPYNNVGGFRSDTLPGNLGNAGNIGANGGSVSVNPAAPVADGRLTSLQSAYQAAFKAAQDAAVSGTDAQRRAADANLRSAEKAFRDAERAASGN